MAITTKKRVRHCRECGTCVESREAVFCSPACRQAFNNRRLQRGAQLYDMFMSLRFNRPLAASIGLWSILCRLASEWRQQDQNERDGRQSWQDPRAHIEKNPWLLRK